MKTTPIAVWDTYVRSKAGTLMHFDIVVPSEVKDTETIYGYGREYLKSKGQEGQALTARECRYCHTESATPAIQAAVSGTGYYILEMEGCDLANG
jgi:Domain of unknown function (DUF2024)